MEASQAQQLDGQSEGFLKSLYDIQTSLRKHIAQVDVDLPFENEDGRRAIEADITLEATEIVRRDVERALRKVEEAQGQADKKNGESGGDGQQMGDVEMKDALSSF